MKTLLFGLDGATYTVLDHLVSLGEMPNLAELYRNGVRAPLLSTPMPITPQAWTTLATGRGAGHHGIHDFVRRERNGPGIYIRVNDGRDNHCETVWELASRQGKRVTVLNYFGIAPPRPVNGHTMPGFVSGRHLRRNSYPPDLFDRLGKVDGFDINILGLDLDIERLALQDMPREQWADWIRHHIRREQVWFGILDHLMSQEPSDFTAIVLDGVDKIQHLAYRFLDPALISPEPTEWEREIVALCRTYFRQVDDFLGRAIRRAGRWARVFVASDHGFTATREIVYINKWLHDQGYLTWRERPEEDSCNAVFSARLADLCNAIDLPRSRAYALTPSCNGIYIDNVLPEQYQSFREELIQKLSALRGPDGGQVITEIKKREECFPGPFSQRVPDLTLTLRDYGLISVLNSRAVVVPRQEPAGTHHPQGVLLGTGPGLLAGQRLGLLSIFDVAPLLLHSLGMEIPASMEGVFPASMYEAEYLASDPPRVGTPVPVVVEAASTSISTSPTTGSDLDEAGEQILMERLKSLGYIE